MDGSTKAFLVLHNNDFGGFFGNAERDAWRWKVCVSQADLTDDPKLTLGQLGTRGVWGGVTA